MYIRDDWTLLNDKYTWVISVLIFNKFCNMKVKKYLEEIEMPNDEVKIVWKKIEDGQLFLDEFSYLKTLIFEECVFEAWINIWSGWDSSIQISFNKCKYKQVKNNSPLSIRGNFYSCSFIDCDIESLFVNVRTKNFYIDTDRYGRRYNKEWTIVVKNCSSHYIQISWKDINLALYDTSKINYLQFWASEESEDKFWYIHIENDGKEEILDNSIWFYPINCNTVKILWQNKLKEIIVDEWSIFKSFYIGDSIVGILKLSWYTNNCVFINSSFDNVWIWNTVVKKLLKIICKKISISESFWCSFWLSDDSLLDTMQFSDSTSLYLSSWWWKVNNCGFSWVDISNLTWIDLIEEWSDSMNKWPIKNDDRIKLFRSLKIASISNHNYPLALQHYSKEMEYISLSNNLSVWEKISLWFGGRTDHWTNWYKWILRYLWIGIVSYTFITIALLLSTEYVRCWINCSWVWIDTVFHFLYPLHNSFDAFSLSWLWWLGIDFIIVVWKTIALSLIYWITQSFRKFNRKL